MEMLVMVVVVLVLVMPRLQKHCGVVVLCQPLDGRHDNLPAVLVHHGGFDDLARHLHRYLISQFQIVIVIVLGFHVICRRRHFVCYCL